MWPRGGWGGGAQELLAAAQSSPELLPFAGQSAESPARPCSAPQVVKASVPLSEMFNYVSTLRGMTKGRAQYTMQVGEASSGCVL